MSDLHRTDIRFMTEALRLAARTPVRPWPNPPVGAVVVKNDRIVGRGAHEGAGTFHAERLALMEAGEEAVGATLYCTLEPCNHEGRTAPCAPFVAEAGLRRVVLGVRDPNPDVEGGGMELLRRAGLDVTVGVCAKQALELIWPFVVTDNFARPYVLLKTATSLDGRFSLHRPLVGEIDNGPVYLTDEPARHDVHVMRRWMDMILVGEETVNVDNPRLDARLVTEQDDCPRSDPAAGYVDTDFSHPDGWDRDEYYVFGGWGRARRSIRDVLSSDGGTIVACAERDGHVDPQSLLEAAARLDISVIMLEGGPTLASAFLANGLVDRWVQYVAPLVAGDGATWPENTAAAEELSFFSLTETKQIGRDLRMTWDREDFTRLQADLSGGTDDSAAGRED